jgi:2-dehydropantoate 2-reductase
LSHNPKISIFGAGSIGCYLGGCLAAAGADIVFIGRERIQRQLNQHGLSISDWKGRKEKLLPEQINFSTHAEGLREADYIFLTVKSGDTKEAAAAILEFTESKTVIISFQNGTQNVGVLRQLLPQHKVLKGMVPFNVLGDAMGQFHCGTEGDIAIEGREDELLPLLEALQRASLPVTLYADITGVQWGKLIMNLNNAVNALSGVPLFEQLNDRGYRLVMAQVITEALLVMKAAGIQPARTGKVIPKWMPYMLSLPNWLFKRVASATLKIDPKARSSMYEDFELKRKTEIDYLNGEIVSLAMHLGIKAPVNQLIVNLVKDAEQKQQGSPKLSAEYLQNVVNAKST